MNNQNDLKELEIEKILSIIFIALSILEIYGSNLEQEYIKTNNKVYADKNKEISIITTIITLIIYFYFLKINIKDYQDINERQKELYSINILGTLLIIVGTFLGLYFQIESNNSLIDELY